MFAFGHFFSTYFLISVLGSKEERKLRLLLSFVGILPDIDLLIPIKHRGITHHIYFFFPEILLYNLILYIFFKKKNLVIPLLIHLLHLFSDSLFGSVEILPNFEISILKISEPSWDFLYGSFFVLFSLIKNFKRLE